jgi:outer membrane protein
MRKLVIALTAALALAPAARAADLKIAVIDLQAAAFDTDEGKAVAAQFGKEADEKSKQFDAKQRELKALWEDFQKQVGTEGVLTEQGKKEKIADLQKREDDLRALYQQLQQELARREQEMNNAMSDRMEKVVKEVADASGITLVLERSVVRYYSSASLDITSEVVRKYNLRFPYKAGAGGKPAGGKPAGGAKPAAGGAKPK